MSDYQLLPPLSDEEYAALKADIAARGVLVPIEFDADGNVLDGHHRLAVWAELRAAGVDVPPYPTIVRGDLSEADKVAHVLALNLARRHLSREERGALVRRLRALDPETYSYPRLGRDLGIDAKTAWRDVNGTPLANAKAPASAPAPAPRTEEESEAYIARLHMVTDAVVGALAALPPETQHSEDRTPEDRAMSEYLRLLMLVRISRHPPELITRQLTPLAAGNDASRVREFIDWLRRLEAALRTPTLATVKEDSR
jgi:hypothetical protein